MLWVYDLLKNTYLCVLKVYLSDTKIVTSLTKARLTIKIRILFAFCLEFFILFLASSFRLSNGWVTLPLDFILTQNGTRY